MTAARTARALAYAALFALAAGNAYLACADLAVCALAQTGRLALLRRQAIAALAALEQAQRAMRAARAGRRA